MNRKVQCRSCKKTVSPDDYCWVRFPHASYPRDGIVHLFRYCSTCESRVGSPVPQSLIADSIGKPRPMINLLIKSEPVHRKSPEIPASIIDERTYQSMLIVVEGKLRIAMESLSFYSEPQMYLRSIHDGKTAVEVDGGEIARLAIETIKAGEE